jgi:hypothetical protein
MNDSDQNHVHTGEAYQAPSKPRSRARRRWGGRVFAFGAFLLLTTGISLGASRHHAQQRQALLTADETRRFAPSVLVAPVEASAAVVPVTLPGTTAAFAAANIYARATGYISRRNIDIGDHVKQGEPLAELAVVAIDEGWLRSPERTRQPCPLQCPRAGRGNIGSLPENPSGTATRSTREPRNGSGRLP